MSNNHIRYLKDRIALCEEPERLDQPELLVGDYSDEMPCKDCSALLLVSNEKALDAELLKFNNELILSEEFLGDVRWLIYSSIFFTSLFWISFFLTINWLIHG